MIVAVAIGSCLRPPATDQGPVPIESTPGLDVPGELWVLIHPSDAPDGAGVFRVDLETQQVLASLPLPFPVQSPHALHDDGTVLWLGSLGDNRIYALDRSDGTVLDWWGGQASEGIRGADGRLWVTQDGRIQEVSTDLDVLDSHSMPGVIQDLAHSDGELFVLQNGGEDTLRSLDLATGQVSAVASRSEVGLHAPYAMEAWNHQLLIGDWLDGWEGTNIVRHYDLQSRSMIGHTLIPIDGWVTALAVPADLEQD